MHVCIFGSQSVLPKPSVRKNHFITIISSLPYTDTFAKYINDTSLENKLFKKNKT